MSRLLVGLLLRAYPRRFRERHGEELVRFLRCQRGEPRYRTPLLGTLRFWLGAGWDAAKNGLAQRLREARSRPCPGRAEAGGVHRAAALAARSDAMARGAWLTDLKLAARGLARSPGFTATVVGTLALGIGAATAVFAVVDAVLLAPLPFSEPDRLVMVWQSDRATGTAREAASTADYFDFVEGTRSFSALAMTRGGAATLTADGVEPRRVTAARVTASLHDVLGVEASLGRGIGPGDEAPGAPPVAVLSHRFWRDGLHGDPRVVGRTLVLDDGTATVVGVLPPGVAYPAGTTDVWLPFRVTPATAVRNPHDVRVVARLAPDVTLAGARAEMDRVAARLEEEVPANANRGAFVQPLEDVLRGDAERTLRVLLGAVAVLLALACVNVATLLVARAAGRRREVAVMAALGGGPARLARRFALEGAVLAAAAGVLGIAFAAWVTGLAGPLVPPHLVTVVDIGLHPRVLLFAVGVSAAVGVGFSLVPLGGLLRTDLHASMDEGGWEGAGGWLPLRRGLVVGQVALAAVLLVGSGLLLQTLHHLHRVDPGFEPENVLTVGFVLSDARYPRDLAVWPDWPAVAAFHRELERRVRAIPGVVAVSVAVNHPLDRGFTNGFSIEGRGADPDRGEVTTRIVTPGYFGTVGLAVLEGRGFGRSDDLRQGPVAILNRAAAERHFPEGDAVGSRLRIWNAAWRTVVGVVEDERVHGLREPAPPAVYVDLHEAPPAETAEVLLVRTTERAGPVADAVQGVFRDLDPQLALFELETLEDAVNGAVARERFVSVVVSFFGAVAALLAALGVHGVLSSAVTRRRHEIGVRMALGASRGAVIRQVALQGLGMSCAGLVLGLALTRMAVAPLAERVLEGVLFGVEVSAPGTYLAAAVLLGSAAAVATMVPSVRAAGTPAARSLREG